MTTQSAGSASKLCVAVPSIAFINSRDGQCSPLIATSQRGGAWARGVARFRAALMIKLGSARWMTSAAIVALTVISGSASWAQSCPTSPSYSPDFSSNQSCLALNSGANGSASFEPGERDDPAAAYPEYGRIRWGLPGTPLRSPLAIPFPPPLRFS